MKIKWTGSFPAAVFCAAMFVPDCAVAQWQLTILPTIEGAEFTAANDVNDLGHIVGRAHMFSRVFPLLWAGGGAQILPVPEGVVEGSPVRINNSDVSVGGTLSRIGTYLPAIWRGTNQVAYVGGGAELRMDSVSDINDTGDAVGSVNLRPVLFRGDNTIPLALLPDQLDGSAKAISNSGIIVGSGMFQFPSEEIGGSPILASQGIIWNGGVPTRLGILPGYSWGYAEAVNDNGLAGGYVATGAGVRPHSERAVLYRNGEAVDFLLGQDGVGLFNRVTDLNDRGDVLGVSGTRGAFLYRDGQVVFLNDLPEVQQSGWFLRHATGINDRGQIVGWGTDAQGFVASAFVLTPVPEPGITIMVAAGLSILVIMRRRLTNRSDTSST